LHDVCDGEEGLEGGQTGWGHGLGIGAKRIARAETLGQLGYIGNM